MSRVYDSNDTDSEVANVHYSSPMKGRRAIKRCAEGNPKSTEDEAPTVFEMLSRQKVEHLEPNKRSQLTRGLIKDPDIIERNQLLKIGLTV